MGSSSSSENSKPPLININNTNGRLEIETPDQLQYIFFPSVSNFCNVSIYALHNAYIALKHHMDQQEPIYEICIGGWNNTRSSIKKNNMKPYTALALTDNILNKNEYRHFWIRWGNKTVMVGRKSETFPFLSWTDVEDITFNYIGIRTTHGASGKWIISQDPIELAPFLKEKEEANEQKIVNIQSKINSIPENRNTRNTSDEIKYLLESSNSMAYETKDTSKNLTKSDSTECTEKITNFAKNNSDGCSTKKNNNCDGFTSELQKEHNDNVSCISTDEYQTKEKIEGNKDCNTHFKNKLERQNIQRNSYIKFDTLVAISKKDPGMIIIEFQNINFERLFETKINKSYINVLTKILSKLCKSDLIKDKTPIINLFSKETFVIQVLNYIQEIPSLPEEKYQKYWWHISQFWGSLFVIANTALNINVELTSSYLTTLINTCEQSLTQLYQMGRRTTSYETKQEFLAVKRKIQSRIQQ